MKTIVPTVKLILLMAFLPVAVIKAQTSTSYPAPEFKSYNMEPGSPAAGSVGATYRFHDVTSDLDALVKINARSSNKVKLLTIDLTSTGYDKALQPQITYDDGEINGSGSWWMEFVVTFVNKNTTTPFVVNQFYTTAVDVDGDNDNLRERQSYYHPTSWTLETGSLLSVSNLLESLLGLLLNVGKTFDGVQEDHSGIDTSSTELMATMRYTNASSMKFRVGATTTGASDNTERMYSIYFRNFTFNAPITLPVKLTSFTATLNNNKSDLKWITASEINVSHFVIEKSFDGTNYSDAGIVFAYGSASEKTNYTYADNVNTAQEGVIYYRLRSVDIDGKTQYSEVRIIRIGKQSTNMMTVLTYPNPVISELRVTIPNNWQNKKVVYELFNANGQVAKKTEATTSSQTETIRVSELGSGFYILRVSCDGEIAQQKIIKQ